MSVDKRLKDLERLERRAEHERHTAWLRSLTDEELDAYMEELRRQDPEACARIDAMTNEELEALIEQDYV